MYIYIAQKMCVVFQRNAFSIFRFDRSDLPLLVAIAGTHTPHFPLVCLPWLEWTAQLHTLPNPLQHFPLVYIWMGRTVWMNSSGLYFTVVTRNSTNQDKVMKAELNGAWISEEVFEELLVSLTL